MWVALRHFPPSALATATTFTLARRAGTLKAGREGQGPLGDLGAVALGSPAEGEAPGTRGAKAGALARLSLMGLAVLAGQVAGVLGAREQLKARKVLKASHAVGERDFGIWMRKFGATLDSAAHQWLAEGPAPPR